MSRTDLKTRTSKPCTQRMQHSMEDERERQTRLLDLFMPLVRVKSCDTRVRTRELKDDEIETRAEILTCFPL